MEQNNVDFVGNSIAYKIASKPDKMESTETADTAEEIP